jgi:hypothetical protein
LKNSHAQGHNGAVLEALFIVSYVCVDEADSTGNLEQIMDHVSCP